MLGSAEDPGVCPRVVDDVFARMNAITADSTAALPMASGRRRDRNPQALHHQPGRPTGPLSVQQSG